MRKGLDAKSFILMLCYYLKYVLTSFPPILSSNKSSAPTTKKVRANISPGVKHNFQFFFSVLHVVIFLSGLQLIYLILYFLAPACS